MRVQMSLVLVALLVLVAVPLYLWRRPHPAGPASETPALDAGVLVGDSLAAAADAGAARALVGTDAAPVAAPLDADAGAPGKRVTLAEARTVKCVGGKGVGRVAPERCDHLAWFEDALARTIRDNVACAPQLPTGGTVSFVLAVDFPHKKTHLFAGKSGSVKRKQGVELVRCIAHALPQPDWASVQHQYLRYDLGILATYPPPAVP